MTKQQVERQYELLFEFHGVQSRLWSMLHETFSPSVFCEANRKDIIAEYLTWESFVEEAKQHNVPYYMGIDLFLESYKRAVYSRLKIED